MQALNMIDNGAINDSLYGGLNVGDIREDRTKAHFLQTSSGSLAHAAGQHNLAVRDGGEHLAVFLARMSSITPSMGMSMMLVVMMSLVLEVPVAGFVPQFTAGNAAILYG
jgi:hypothetical protein